MQPDVTNRITQIGLYLKPAPRYLEDSCVPYEELTERRSRAPGGCSPWLLVEALRHSSRGPTEVRSHTTNLRPDREQKHTSRRFRRLLVRGSPRSFHTRQKLQTHSIWPQVERGATWCLWTLTTALFED